MSGLERNHINRAIRYTPVALANVKPEKNSE
jgi:hypothetical protein